MISGQKRKCDTNNSLLTWKWDIRKSGAWCRPAKPGAIIGARQNASPAAWAMRAARHEADSSGPGPRFLPHRDSRSFPSPDRTNPQLTTVVREQKSAAGGAENTLIHRALHLLAGAVKMIRWSDKNRQVRIVIEFGRYSQPDWGKARTSPCPRLTADKSSRRRTCRRR